MEKIIVSRHPAAIEFIKSEIEEFTSAKVYAEVTAEDVRGKIVAGNLPLQLASEAVFVIAVEFDGIPPRGQEYGVAEMQQAGARLATYKVERI